MVLLFPVLPDIVAHSLHQPNSYMQFHFTSQIRSQIVPFLQEPVELSYYKVGSSKIHDNTPDTVFTPWGAFKLLALTTNILSIPPDSYIYSCEERGTKSTSTCCLSKILVKKSLTDNWIQTQEKVIEEEIKASFLVICAFHLFQLPLVVLATKGQ